MNRNTMRAEYQYAYNRYKTMSIWRDHVTVILYGYGILNKLMGLR